ncbi:MAG: hypothetical protein HDT48_08215 [Ruminococcaceae bacterium]|nr:hypothetical protein [Oscillospiraceae bacterium]
MSKDDETEEKIGEILFACCNLSNIYKKESEKSLTMAINRFIMQFREMEDKAVQEGKTIDQMPQDEVLRLFAAKNEN